MSQETPTVISSISSSFTNMGNEVSPSCGLLITSSSVPTSARSPATRVAGVMRKAIKLLVINDDKLILQVFLLQLLPFSLIVLLHYIVAGPLMQKVEDSYESLSLDLKSAGALVGLEIPFLFTFSLVWLFGMTTTISAAELMYTGKSLRTLQEFILSILSKWKKPISTWLYVLFLMIIYIVLSSVSTQLTSLIGTRNAALSWLMGTLTALFYPYLASLTTLALVISAMEENFHGGKALAEARRLVGYRKLDGYLLMLTLILLSIPIYVLFYVTTMDDDDELGLVTRLAFMFMASGLFCLTNLFAFVVYTVFYFECKQSHREKIEIEFGPGYQPAHAMVHADI